PALERRLLRARDRELAGGRIPGDGRTRAAGRVFADGHRRDQRRIRTDERTIGKRGGRLVRTVVNAGDGAGADVLTSADDRIAEVGEVVGLAADPDARVLGLDEIADVRAVGEHAAGAQPRERPDLHRAFAAHAVEVAMCADFAAGGELDVLQPAERAD